MAARRQGPALKVPAAMVAMEEQADLLSLAVQVVPVAQVVRALLPELQGLVDLLELLIQIKRAAQAAQAARAELVAPAELEAT
jgi:hypothetical protein